MKPVQPNNQYRARPSTGPQRPAVAMRQLPKPVPVAPQSKPAIANIASPAAPRQYNHPLPQQQQPQQSQQPPPRPSPYQSAYQPSYQPANQPTNQPNNQSINQSVQQRAHQSFQQPVVQQHQKPQPPATPAQSAQKPTHQPFQQPVQQPAQQPAYPATRQSVYQTPNQPIRQPNVQPIPQPPQQSGYQQQSSPPSTYAGSMVARMQKVAAMDDDLYSELAGFDMPTARPATSARPPLVAHSTPMQTRSSSHQQPSHAPYSAQSASPAPSAAPPSYSRSVPISRPVAPVALVAPVSSATSTVRQNYPNTSTQLNQKNQTKQPSPYQQNVHTPTPYPPQPQTPYNQQRPSTTFPGPNPYLTAAPVVPMSYSTPYQCTPNPSAAPTATMSNLNPNTGSPNKRKASELDSALHVQPQPVTKRPQPDVSSVAAPPYSNSYVPPSSAASTLSHPLSSGTSSGSALPPEVKDSIAKNREIAELKKNLRNKDQALRDKEEVEKSKAVEVAALKEKLARMERDLASATQANVKQEASKLQYELDKQKQIVETLRAELEAQAFNKPKKEPVPVVEAVKREEPVAKAAVVSMSQQAVPAPVPSLPAVILPASAPTVAISPSSPAITEAWTKTVDHSLLAFAARPVLSAQLILAEVIDTHKTGSGSAGLQEALKLLSGMLEDHATHLNPALSDISADLHRCCQLVMTDCLEPGHLLKPCVALLAQALRLMADSDVAMSSDVADVSDETRAAIRSRARKLAGHVVQALLALVVNDSRTWRSLTHTSDSVDVYTLTGRRSHPAFSGRSRIVSRSASQSAPSDQLDRFKDKRSLEADTIDSAAVTSLVVQFVELYMKHPTPECSSALAAALRFLVAVALESDAARAAVLSGLGSESMWTLAYSGSFSEDVRVLALDLVALWTQYEENDTKPPQFFVAVHERQQTCLDHLMVSLAKSDDRALRLPIIRILSAILRCHPSVIDKKALPLLITALERAITDETHRQVSELHPDAMSNLTLDVRPSQKLAMTPRPTTSLAPRQIACLQACIELLALTLDTSITAGIDARLSSNILGALSDVHRLMSDRVELAGRCSVLLVDTRWHEGMHMTD